MNGIINENELIVVKEYKFDNPLIQNNDCLIDNCYKDCHYKYFHSFECECVYNLNFTNITNNESVNFTISNKNLGMYELNKKLTLARERGYIFNQIKKLTIKNYSNLSYINIHYHLKLGASPLHCQFFKKLAQNRDYIQTHCNKFIIVFISHVDNGIHIITQVYLNEFIYLFIIIIFLHVFEYI